MVREIYEINNVDVADLVRTASEDDGLHTGHIKYTTFDYCAVKTLKEAKRVKFMKNSNGETSNTIPFTVDVQAGEIIKTPPPKRIRIK